MFLGLCATSRGFMGFSVSHARKAHDPELGMLLLSLGRPWLLEAFKGLSSAKPLLIPAPFAARPSVGWRRGCADHASWIPQARACGEEIAAFKMGLRAPSLRR